MTFSCYGCTERTPTCHATCETYISERKEWLELKRKNRDPLKNYVSRAIVVNRDISAKRRRDHPLKSGCIR